MAYVNDSGYPSPSDILEPWIDKRWFKPEHAERGTSVHASINASMKDLVAIWDPEHQGYRDSFNQIRDYFEEVVFSERRLVDKTLCYSGQVDAVAELSEKGCAALSLPHPTLALVDWKTSANESKDWPIKMAAYFNLCAVNEVKVDVHLLARINKEGGKPKLRLSLKPEIRFYFGYWKACLNAWYYFNTAVKFHV